MRKRKVQRGTGRVGQKAKESGEPSERETLKAQPVGAKGI